MPENGSRAVTALKPRDKKLAWSKTACLLGSRTREASKPGDYRQLLERLKETSYCKEDCEMTTLCQNVLRSSMVANGT